MKRISCFAGAVIAALAIFSCTKEDFSVLDNNQQTGVKEFGETVFTLSAGIDETKVSLDGVHLSWSLNDQIVVNGVCSKPLASIDEDTGLAEFEFDQELTAPFHAIFPASAYVEESYSTTEEGVRTNICFPAKHTYYKNGLDPSAAVLTGTSGTKETLKFSHAVTYLKLTFDKDVKSVRVMANNGARVAGYLKIDYDGNVATDYYAKPNYNTVTLTGEITAGDPAVIAIPAKNYSDGLNIFVVTTDNQYQVLKTSGFDASSKKGTLLVKSASLDNLKDWSGPGIYNEEDWKSFVFADESKYSTDLTQKGDASDWLGEDGEYNIYEDFTVTGNLRRHGANEAGFTTTGNINFIGVIDGNNHTITQTASIVPIIGYVGSDDPEGDGGTIKNLTLAGECKSIGNVNFGNASFAGKVFRKGGIENCTNKVNTSITEGTAASSTILLSGFAAFNQGTITNCVNEGDMEYNAYYSAARKFYTGGISSQNYNSTSGAHGYGDFISCTNKGSLKVTKKSDSKIAARYAVIGGICAGVMGGASGDAETGVYSSFNQCANEGDITFWEDGNSLHYSVICGGIIGASTPYGGTSNCPDLTGVDGYYFVIRTGKNTGNFDVSSSCTSPTTAAVSGARQVYVGGLVGFALGSASLSGTTVAKTEYAIIRGGSDCTMKLGSLVGNECAGGIVGGGGFLSLEYITSSSVKIEKTENTMFTPTNIGAVAALIGLNVKRTLVTGNNNSPLLKIDASNAGLPVSFEGLSGNTGMESAAADGKPETDSALPYLIYEKSSVGTESYIINFAGKKTDNTTYTAGPLSKATTTSGVECFYGTGSTVVRDAGRVTVVEYTE
ncbi:MAG: hypothetical protein ACI395_04760 [Candidatus Cryptobacteroides sp.]